MVIDIMAEDLRVLFEYQTIVESFLREFYPVPKKLDDIPVELWMI